MTNQNLYDLVNFVMRKNGVSEPLTGQRFELLLQQENKNHYKDMVTSYMKSQKVMDSLSPFEVNVQVSTLTVTTTTIDLPTDYAHFVGMYHTDDDSIVRPFDMVTDDQWDMRCRNRITVPTDNNPICKILKNKIYIKPDLDSFVYDDWFLPSSLELYAMYTYLHLEGVGGFTLDYYSSSSEYDADQFRYVYMKTGLQGTTGFKQGEEFKVRACRSFTSSTTYSLREVGPAGGLIFYVDGTTYYEAAPADLGYSAWSNINNVLLGTTSVLIGEGNNNSNKIINQVGHVNSAAKLCLDYSITIN